MNPKHILIERLEEMRASLIARDALQIQNVAEETELTRIIADRDIEAARLTNSTSVIKEILDAMNRVDTQQYGLCVECDEAISARRLEALPWAKRCIRCQEHVDGNEGSPFVHESQRSAMAA